MTAYHGIRITTYQSCTTNVKNIVYITAGCIYNLLCTFICIFVCIFINFVSSVLVFMFLCVFLYILKHISHCLTLSRMPLNMCDCMWFRLQLVSNILHGILNIRTLWGNISNHLILVAYGACPPTTTTNPTPHPHTHSSPPPPPPQPPPPNHMLSGDMS